MDKTDGKLLTLILIGLLAFRLAHSQNIQTNYATSFTGATNVVVFTATAASNQWNYLFVHVPSACRMSFNEATTASSPIYEANTVWKFGPGDKIPTIHVRTTNATQTVTINIAGRVQ